MHFYGMSFAGIKIIAKVGYDIYYIKTFPSWLETHHTSFGKNINKVLKQIIKIRSWNTVMTRNVYKGYYYSGVGPSKWNVSSSL